MTLDPHHLRILREWDKHAGTRYAAEAEAEVQRARRESVQVAKAATASRSAKRLMARITELEAELARAQSTARPLSAAELAVQWGLPLTQARRVWRVLTEST